MDEFNNAIFPSEINNKTYMLVEHFQKVECATILQKYMSNTVFVCPWEHIEKNKNEWGVVIFVYKSK